MQILRDNSLQSFNTLALEATATAMAMVDSATELGDALSWARAQSLPVIPLGQGSNIVLAGSPEAMWLCQQSQGMQVLKERDNTVLLRVDAGHDWHRLVERTLQLGYYGLENLALIPGTVGAAPIQNIGAYGVEAERFIRAVHAVELDTTRAVVLSAAECDFGYRDSIFKGELRDRLVITAVDLELDLHPSVELAYPALRDELERRDCSDPSPDDIFDAVVRVRSSRLPDPALEPNAGSFFKNPVVSAGVAKALTQRWETIPSYPQGDGSVKLPAAWLIDQAGWKGKQREGVGVHDRHALVLVNRGSNSGIALLALADDIVKSVVDMFGVLLEMEPRVYGRIG